MNISWNNLWIKKISSLLNFRSMNIQKHWVILIKVQPYPSFEQPAPGVLSQVVTIMAFRTWYFEGNQAI
jgi:hypothetical protein